MEYSQKDIERFWSKVDKEKSAIFYNGTRCWEWTASCDTSGYGGIRVGKMQRTNRVSYELSFGKIQNGLFVLHHCDNRKCCNPAHLFLGTNQDNVDDMIRKGRHADFRGEKNPSCKLSDAKVSEVRQRYQSLGFFRGVVTQLSREFDLSRRQILRIVLRKSRS